MIRVNRIKEIFEAKCLCDVLARYVFTINKFYYCEVKEHSSPKYKDAIFTLMRTIEANPHFDEQEVKDACNCFAIAENCGGLYDKLHAKLGQLVCHFVLGNMLVVDNLVNTIIYSEIPMHLNVAGVLQKTGKPIVAATGVVIATIPELRTLGYALAQCARNMHTDENCIVPDKDIYNLISDIKDIDFKATYNLILNK